MNLALSAGGTEVSSVNYKITGNGLTREGTIPLTANGNTFSALIPGIPVGQGYTIALNGAGGDGAGQCVGSAQFGITAGQTSSVTVHLRCPGSKQTGSLLVNGDINTCAVAESAGAASTNITVGNPVVLTGIGADQDQAPSALTYTWTIVGGAATLKDANKATAELTCTAPSNVLVELAVTDGDCGESTSITLSCEAVGPIAGAPSTAGTSAAGSSSAGTLAGGTGGAGTGTAGTSAAGSSSAGTLAGGTGGAGTGAAGSTGVDYCAGIGSSCHGVDPGTGPLHECHELGHAGDQTVCQTRRADCIDLCGNALCEAVATACHPFHESTGPLHDCHELGHDGDAAACFATGGDCLKACNAAGTAGSGGAGSSGAGTGGAGSGGAGSGGGTGPIPVTLNFKAVVGNQDFACGRNYSGLGSTGTSVTPLDFRLFVQDVKLVRADGQEVPVQLSTRAPWQSPTVALLDFENGSGGCAGDGTAETNTTITGTAPAGDYVGVVFTNGVPFELNHADPTTLPDPMKTYPTLTWGWLGGFRFIKAEVQTADAIQSWMHLGSGGCSGAPTTGGTVTCTRPNRNKVSLSNFTLGSSVIVADFAQIFANSDISQEQGCHGSPQSVCEPMFASFGVGYVGGVTLNTQSVYHVE